MKLISIVAACVMLAPPTYQSCFDAYWRDLNRIAEAEGYGTISHWEAVNQRALALNAYADCKQAAWEEWVRQWWRETMEAIQ